MFYWDDDCAISYLNGCLDWDDKYVLCGLRLGLEHSYLNLDISFVKDISTDLYESFLTSIGWLFHQHTSIWHLIFLLDPIIKESSLHNQFECKQTTRFTKCFTTNTKSSNESLRLANGFIKYTLSTTPMETCAFNSLMNCFKECSTVYTLMNIKAFWQNTLIA